MASNVHAEQRKYVVDGLSEDLMRSRILIAGFVVLVGACADASVQLPAVPTTTVPSASPTETVLATPTPSAAANYPYSLSWPPEQLESDWTFATAAWDGTSRIDHGNRYTDYVETSDGSLFAFGIPMSGRPEELRQLVAQQAVDWHGCEEEPLEEESLSGGEAEGLYGVYTCGSRTVLRWFGVHDGFGVFVGLIVDPGVDLDVVTTRFKDQIGGLKWTA